ncbi:hypothetical protein HMN09_00367700 [Mycena chlorophos]|uniref:ATP synthase subunit f, mitochondrial n=1 Tax=Mycena chlorophos TaxID=658473 RepID=A0A8H6TK15_MYCCL|nr:hypothetical protein HMN09_00367700 [Mycena chlorophos]
MYASAVRRSLQGLVPPKIATPKLVAGDSAGPLGPLVSFYSKLPKGPAPASAAGGIKARYFSGKNASAKPVLALIGGLWLIGYSLDYQRASSSFSVSTSLADAFLSSPFPSIRPLVALRRSPSQAPQEQRALESEVLLDVLGVPPVAYSKQYIVFCACLRLSVPLHVSVVRALPTHTTTGPRHYPSFLPAPSTSSTSDLSMVEC